MRKTGASKNTPGKKLRDLTRRGRWSQTTGAECIKPVARSEPPAFYSPLGTGGRRPSLGIVQPHKTARPPLPYQCRGRTPNTRGQRSSSSPPCVNRRGPSPWLPRGCHSSSAFVVLLSTSSSVPTSLSHDAPWSMSTLTGGRFSLVPLPIRFETTLAPHGMSRSSRITPL